MSMANMNASATETTKAFTVMSSVTKVSSSMNFSQKHLPSTLLYKCLLIADNNVVGMHCSLGPGPQPTARPLDG